MRVYKCSEKERKYAREWRRSHKPPYDPVYHKAYRTRHRARAFFNMLMWNYGLSQEDFSYLLGKQLNRCAVCKRSFELSGGRNKTAHVDHDHSKQKGDPGYVRGLLCMECNKAEGCLKSDPVVVRRLADYLEEHIQRTSLCSLTP